MFECRDCSKALKLVSSKRCNSCENKRRWKDPILRKKLIIRLSESHMGQVPSNLKGLIKLAKSKESRKKRSKRMLGKSHDHKTSNGYPAWNKGKKTGIIPKSAFKKGDRRLVGENNHGWKGGVSFHPYPLEFNETLKEKIRKRDNYICQECKHSQEKLGYKLHAHHIDYNKKNNSEDNLISLCRACHAQTGFNRKDWENYYKKRLEVANA